MVISEQTADAEMGASQTMVGTNQPYPWTAIDPVTEPLHPRHPHPYTRKETFSSP